MAATGRGEIDACGYVRGCPFDDMCRTTAVLPTQTWGMTDGKYIPDIPPTGGQDYGAPGHSEGGVCAVSTAGTTRRLAPQPAPDDFRYYCALTEYGA
jgi:hypothetical protein